MTAVVLGWRAGDVEGADHADGLVGLVLVVPSKAREAVGGVLKGDGVDVDHQRRYRARVVKPGQLASANWPTSLVSDPPS